MAKIFITLSPNLQKSEITNPKSKNTIGNWSMRNSESSGRGDAKHGSLEPSCRDGFIGGGFASLGSMGAELFNEM